MRQNPFFFSKAKSTTNDFNAEDLINTMQIIGEGWAPLVHGFPLPSDPSSLSRADLKGLQGTSETRGKGELEEQRNSHQSQCGNEIRRHQNKLRLDSCLCVIPFCAIPVSRYLFFPVWSDLCYSICPRDRTYLLISWKEDDGMLGKHGTTLLS